jgi:hypothetical protein
MEVHGMETWSRDIIHLADLEAPKPAVQFLILHTDIPGTTQVASPVSYAMELELVKSVAAVQPQQLQDATQLQ